MIGSVLAPSPSLFAPAAKNPAGASGGNAQGGSLLQNPNELTDEEEKQVQELKARDTEVRAHEQAHKTVGGPYAGAVSYETTTGPDGRDYAVAGEVKIDVSPVSNNAEATVRKMEIVERAALAPAEPSPQDRAVAAQARAIKIQAQADMQEQQQAEKNGEEKPKGILAEVKAAMDAYLKGEEPDRIAETQPSQNDDTASTFFTPVPTILFA